jgi:hypothetical protein
MFEDPDSAIWVADQMGIEVPETMQKDFLDEMRYIRCRNWLFEVFWPSPMKKPEGLREEVIGNRLVPVIDLSSNQEVDVASRL